MSDESNGKRGLLTDICIFAVVIGLALAAVYFTGNWDRMMKMLISLEKELRSFASMFLDNINSVVGVYSSK